MRDKLQADMAYALTKLQVLADKANASRASDEQVGPDYDQRQQGVNAVTA